jgi:cytochrome c peroxidase
MKLFRNNPSKKVFPVAADVSPLQYSSENELEDGADSHRLLLSKRAANRNCVWERLGTRFLPALLLFFLSQKLFAATLEISISPVANGNAIQPASLRYETSSGEKYSITRVSYLLSDFALQRPDGSRLELTNQVAWFDLEKNRSIARLEIPPEEFISVRFDVGLNKELNHSDAAKFPAEHPLNPNVNGLHWSWQGGYIFLALEGMWRNQSGQFDGWSFHLARDGNQTRVNLPAHLQLAEHTKLEIDFDVSVLLNAPRPISFVKDGSSTHSRDGDPIAAALVANLPGSFRVRKISNQADAELLSAKKKPLFLPKKFTPYRFEISATFPIPDLPQDNPLIEERVALGRKLFNETALSRDGTISCASCHNAQIAFSDSAKFSRGVDGRTGTRNAMPLFNLAWKNSFFWDGRAPSLRAQAMFPIQEHVEMDASPTNIVAKLSAQTEYKKLFQSAFDPPKITAEKIGLALEQFVLTLTSFDSKFDRVLKGEESFTPDEQRGFELFSTEYDPRRGQFGADCFHCHGGMLFQSQTFANNGLDRESGDLGRFNFTQRAADKGKFAVPSLRNVALTAPYMHDGRFATLEEVVEHYSTGMKRSATLDPNLAKHPDGGVPLSDEDKRALVAFLKTLTGDAYSSPLETTAVSAVATFAR